MFVKRLFQKMIADDVLFLASGISFNILLSLFPILALWIYALGLWFKSAKATAILDAIISKAIPHHPHTSAIRDDLMALVTEFTRHRSSLEVLTVLVLLWTAASLFPSIRSALHRIFEVKTSRHVVFYYVKDLLMSLAMTFLIIGTVSIRWILHGLKKLQQLLSFGSPLEASMTHWLGTITIFASVPVIFIFCFLLYRYAPAEHTDRKTCMIAALTTSVIWEISNHLFGFYFTQISSYSKLYGAYASILVLMVWIFYSCLIFVLGAEVAQVYRTRHHHAHTP